MQRDIAAICASPPGLNPGMESVDRALLDLAERHGFADRIHFYRLYPPRSGALEGEHPKIEYSIIPRDDSFFRSQAAIIYWGDFLHMRQYHETVARMLVQDGSFHTIDTAMSRVRQVFLQAGQDSETLRKSLTFGGTLLFNTAADEMDPGYQTPLARFLNSCRAAWFRDVYSAFKACLIRGSFESSCLGVDCANLIDPRRMYPHASRPAAEDRVGLFLGRTAGNTQAMLDFASELANALTCRLAWLSWGDGNAFPELPSIFKHPSIRALDSFTAKPSGLSWDGMAALLKYRAIVTDTYHLCVNAWNMGVPAVCLLGDEYSENRNVNYGANLARRDKRLVFMSMYDALEFLVRADELDHAERGQARILKLVDLIHSGRQVAEIAGRIRAHAQYAERSFVDALLPIL